MYNLETPAVIYLGVCGTPTAYVGVKHVLDIRGKYQLAVSGLYVAEKDQWYFGYLLNDY